MSWIEKLYQTYENNPDKIGDKNDKTPLFPLFHTTKKRAHVEIILDGNGSFKRAYIIPEDTAKTILPATENSAGRTSGCAPHPLADQLQYVAADYEKYAGTKEYFDSLLVKFKGNKKLFGELVTNSDKDKKGCLRRILIENKQFVDIIESFKAKKQVFSSKIDADIRERKTDKIYYDLIDSDSLLIRKNNNKLTKNKRKQKEQYVELRRRIGNADQLSDKEKNYLKANILEYVYPSIETGHIGYLDVLEGWKESEYANQKIKAVYRYISKGTLISDLVSEKVLHVDENGKLLGSWKGKRDDKPDIFKVLGQGQKQTDTFIRWSVEIPGEPSSEMQYDKTVWQSWIDYYRSTRSKHIFCYVSGESTTEEPKYKTEQYPRMIRSDNDGAKLISSNDTSGFTYRGRFTDECQVCGVDVRVAQKAHNALRWLIARQGKNVFYVKNEPKLAFVAWAVSAVNVPDPLADSDDLLSDTSIESEMKNTEKNPFGFTAQEFGVRLSKYLSGYSVKLDATDQIVVMGIDSATPGRMAVTYYRELTASDFLNRLKSWHKGCAWLQRFSKDKIFFGAPAPKDIAQVAYGTKDGDLIKVDDNLQKTTVERLIPCIIDGAPLPWDIVNSCIKKATQRQSLPDWAWQKILGIACGLFRYYCKEREDYTMGLDRKRKTRDYLYGRLFAVADCLEGYALKLSNERRQTNATKLMQRFAERPCSTWKTIELALVPYKTRLSRNNKYEKELDDIHGLFADIADYTSDGPLSGEFLLGFHCQRAELFKSTQEDTTDKEENENEYRE